LQISTGVCNIRGNECANVFAQAFAASKAALNSKSGEGKLDESQGRKASGLHDQGHLPAGLPSEAGSVFRCCVALYLLTQTKGGYMRKHSNRNTPVEQWPESLEILRHLSAQTAPIAVKDVARDVSAPEISTRNRLAKLEARGTVRATRSAARLGPDRQVVCTHYVITQYGKDCVGTRAQQSQALKVSGNSVFSWAAAMGQAGT
jgi:hypothetical protein